MKNFSLLALVTAVAMLTACGSTKEPNRQEESAKLIEKKAPDWALNPPVSTATEYKALGEGVSSSMVNAVNNARASAFESICYAADSTVRSQTKSFRQDTESKSTAVTTTATRNICADIDVTGATIEKQFTFRDGERFRAFVLVTLDKGINGKQAKQMEGEFQDLDRAATNIKEKRK
jgi:hypothetical protein